MAIAPKDVQKIKGEGFLRNRGTDEFSCRIVAAGGVYTAEQFREIAALAEVYGSGKIVITSRQGAELPGIAYERVGDVQRRAEEKLGMEIGGTGAKVRPVVACKGTTCVYGNADTQALARTLHERFYVGMHGVSLSHKFKIAVGGCPNGCQKPSLNDLGIEAHRAPGFAPEKCRACKNCAVQEACPVKAVGRDERGRPVFDSARCRTCGLCGSKCPFGAVTSEEQARFVVTVGGTWGKEHREGAALAGTFALEQIPDLVEKVILWYRENGLAKERLSRTIDRVGLPALEAAVHSEDILARRDAILAAPIRQA